MPTIHHGDCIETMNAMPPESVDAIVCDPPYGLSNTTPAQVADTIAKWAGGDRGHVPTGRGFMGKSWDAFVPPPAVWDECMRVLKPGGHMVVFAGSRTHDLMGLSIRLAGFEMRDSLAWLYGSGFPKSHDVGKAIDKLAGAEREVVGTIPDRWTQKGSTYNMSTDRPQESVAVLGAPATPEAAQWDGWGTALKPAFEPIVLARKPLAEKTVARNVLAHGTGAINVDACRVTPLTGAEVARSGKSTNGGIYGDCGSVDWKRDGSAPSGRWPANVLLDHHAAAWVDEQSGESVSKASASRGKRGGMLRLNGFHTVDELRAAAGAGERTPNGRDARATLANYEASPDEARGHTDSGGASRFFYTAKAPKSERPNVDGVQHPTVKPLAIMRWLLRLVTPPGGTVLDPFAGSGATVEAALIEGFNPIGIELEAEYLPLIQHRIDRQGGDES